MRIRKLELFGFKSFPDRTAFEFGPGISCVVGPNGSGKSNVVDALRWCIGEQSARSLRGADMADVIFAGSSERSPVGFAEVALTLASDGGEPFPGDWARFEELEVGRRLYRDGTSEYLVNRVKCRRRDVVDLFLDTGVGANLYSFIAQGQVDRIVSQAPSERRGLIDEAAGISRYKARRDEAIARLTATASQLDRAADVADEMGRRLKVLERQVIRAGQFRRSRARIRQGEIALGVVKYHALSGDRRVLRDALRRATDAVGARKRSIERQDADLATRSAEASAVQEAVASLREHAAELDAQRREAESARSHHVTRERELGAARERAAARVRAAEALVQSSTADEASAREDAASQEARVDPAEVAEARRAREDAEGRWREVRELLSRIREREAAREERWRVAREEIERLERRLEELDAEQDPPAGPTHDLEAAVRDARTRRDEARGHVDEAKAQVARARVRVAEEEAEDARRRSEAHAAIQRWERVRADREARQRELTAWGARTLASWRASQDAEAQRARAGVRERAAAWIRALEQAARAERARDDAAHAEALAGLADRAARDDRALAEGERARGAAALDGVDRSGLEALRAEVADAERRVVRAREAEEAARQASSACRGRRVALEAEWEVLDARRTASLPDSWVERALPSPEDPRRLPRPEIASLPVLEPADLSVERGRGVLAHGRVPWEVVPDVRAAIDAVREGRFPLVTVDGAVRVDADGVVEIGPRAEDRWERVRSELDQVRAEEMSLDAALELACAETASAVPWRRARSQALEQAEQALAREEARVLAVVAEQIRDERRRVAESGAAARAALVQAEDARRAARQSALEAAVRQAEIARDAVLDALVPAPVPVHVLTSLVGRAWPGPVDSRPSEPTPGDLSASRAVVDRAERALGEATARWEQALGAEEAAVAELGAQRRRADEVRSRQEARAAEVAAIRARLGSVRTVLDGPTEASTLASAEAEAVDLETHLGRVTEAAAAAEAARIEAVERSRAALERAALALEARERADADRRRALEDVEVARAAEDAARQDAVRCAEVAGQAAAARKEVLERAASERERLERLAGEVERVRAALDGDRRRVQEEEAERVALQRRVEEVQGEIEALRAQLGDRYQVSIPGLLDRLTMRKELVIEVDPGVAEPLRVGDVELEGVRPLELGPSFLDDEDRVVGMVDALEAERAALQSLGEVNLAAEAEYTDLLGRWTDLDTQRGDLESSVQTLRAAIAKTNRICRERFRDAYDRVNEAFQQSYPRLVGGGDARLALTDEDDLLETGVDIFVRPPGKRLQNLTLLSGGEKAMTAIALLLALFQVKPSPFCVLDEVDAPLDEANGGRFNDMVREMSRLSQFIVITHNRRTMECADVLYGVTMARPGVSTLVSVALERGVHGVGTPEEAGRS